MAKGVIACFEQLLPLSQCIQTSSAAEASKSFYMWERVKSFLSLVKKNHTLWNKEKLLKIDVSIFSPLKCFQSRHHLTLSHIQLFCSRWFWKLLGQKMVNLYNCRYKLLKEVEKHCGKWRNCLCWAIFPFATIFSKVVCSRGIRIRLQVGKG